MGEVAGRQGAAVATVLGSAALNVLSDAIFSAYSREMEMEADKLGARYLADAGYPLAAAVALHDKLDDLTKREGTGPKGIFATHPTSSERRRIILEYLRGRE
jgi:predicted Zn-dependent protease